MIARTEFLFFFFLLFSFPAFSQLPIQGTVVDSKTKIPLPFCNVSIKNTSRLYITNQDGVYKIAGLTALDTLVFSYIGYRTQGIHAATLQKNPVVLMESKSIAIKEAVIHADDNYLYDIMEQCRKNLLSSKQQTAKVYFQLETAIQEQPVEMLECYYNGDVKGNEIEKLLLKNGRIGLAESKDNGYFTSRNTSKAITYLNLTEQNKYLPGLPLQYRKSKLKNHFALNIIDNDSNGYHIGFTPRSETNSYFTGEIWIDKKTSSILKIDLNCDNCLVHPFLPLFEGGKIDSVGMNITQSYNLTGSASSLNYINFKYRFSFNNGHPNSRSYNGNSDEYTVHTNGLMFFYDYEKPFLLPWFKYDIDESDYRKITSMPYNESFWKSNEKLLFTDKQKNSLEFFSSNGVLVNYSNTRSKLKGNYNAFEDNNITWSATGRISLKVNHLDSLLFKDASLQNKVQSLISDLYHLDIQIFLDVNPADDSIQHYSATVLDIFKSYYNLPAETYTDCFLNICFDLTEIERRGMEKTLSLHSWSISQIDSIYKSTATTIDKQTTKYLKEVQSGKNQKELEKWNEYVFQNLGIDNKKVFGLK